MVPMEKEGVPIGHTVFLGTGPVPNGKPSRFKFGPKSNRKIQNSDGFLLKKNF